MTMCGEFIDKQICIKILNCLINSSSYKVQTLYLLTPKWHKNGKYYGCFVINDIADFW